MQRVWCWTAVVYAISPFFLRMPQKYQPGLHCLGNISHQYFPLELGGEAGSFFYGIDGGGGMVLLGFLEVGGCERTLLNIFPQKNSKYSSL